MSQDEKPGWLGRLFGRKATPEPAPETVEPPVESPASPAEGQPDFATAADDVTHVPLPPAEPSPVDADRNAVPDATEGADLQPIEGAPETPPSGTAGDDPARGAEPADTTTVAREPAIEAEEETGAGTGAPDIQPVDAAAALAHDAVTQGAVTQGAVTQGAVTQGAVAEAPPEPAAEKRGWWTRLTSGMKRTSSALSDRVTGLFTKRKLDANTLEDLEDALIQADFGVETATRISEAVGKGRYEKGISPDEVRAILAAEVERALEPVAKPLVIDATKKPFVILMIGVNGAGKTTTLGKLSLSLKAEGRRVMLAAGDTFRAAAIEQLKVWGERTGTPVVSGAQGADAAGLAFDALKRAKAEGTDVLLVDTAGRLQNKAGLMAELEKIIRVLRKSDPEAPHATLLVLDATVGQNALSQVELFSKAAPVSGLVMTKLDGTARGGILIALAAKFGLPVHFIGVGEGIDDLEPFAARDFARAIAGLEKE